MLIDDQNRVELKFLLQTKDEYDALIRATKALIAELDDKVDCVRRLLGMCEARQPPCCSESCNKSLHTLTCEMCGSYF